MLRCQDNQIVFVGSTVECVDNFGAGTLEVGKQYIVMGIEDSNLTLNVNYSTKYNIRRFKLVRTASVLTPQEVSNALLSGIPLEYYMNERWVAVLRPASISIYMMQNTDFRYKVERQFDFFGELFTAPLEELPLNTKVYGISFSKRQVYPVMVRHNTDDECTYWSRKEDAQEVLAHLLKPFNVEVQPLREDI